MSNGICLSNEVHHIKSVKRKVDNNQMTCKSIKFAFAWAGNDPAKLATLSLRIEYQSTIAMVNIMSTQIKPVAMKINMIFASSFSSSSLNKVMTRNLFENGSKDRMNHQTKNCYFLMFKVYVLFYALLNTYIFILYT